MTSDEKEAKEFLEANGVDLNFNNRAKVFMLVDDDGELGRGADVSLAACDAIRRDPDLTAARRQLLHLAAALSLGAEAVWEAFTDEDDEDDDPEEDEDDEDSESGPMRIRRG